MLTDLTEQLKRVLGKDAVPRELTPEETSRWEDVGSAWTELVLASRKCEKMVDGLLDPRVDMIVILRTALNSVGWRLVAIRVCQRIVDRSRFASYGVSPSALLPLLPELAFISVQGRDNETVEAGRIITMLPRKPVVEWLSGMLQPLLGPATDWEWRRLLGLVRELDAPLTLRFAAEALKSPDPEIREAGQDAIDVISGGSPYEPYTAESE